MIGLPVIRFGVLASVAATPLLGGCVERTVYVDRPVYRAAPVVVARPAPVAVVASPAGSIAQPFGVPSGSTVVIAQPAPLPEPVVTTEVVTVSPGPGYIWIPGAYEWGGASYIWVGGHWGRPIHPHAAWVRGGWRHAHGGYRWERGHWH